MKLFTVTRNLTRNAVKRVFALTAAATLAALVAPNANAKPGAVGGPVFGRAHVVAAYGEYHYFIAFIGGLPAAVSAHGDGDIDIYVRDATGRVIAADASYDADPTTEFFALNTGVFEVIIRNKTGRPVFYDFSTN